MAPPPAEPVASRPVPPTNRKQPNVPAARTGRGGSWDDPFATDSGASRKTTASRAVRPADDDFAAAPARKNVAARPAADDDLFAPPAKRNAAASQPARRGGASWDDPFADSGSRTVPAKRAAPVSAMAPARPAKSEPAPRASGGSWKDPFTDDSTAARPVRRAAAAPEPAKTARKSAVVARETSPAKEDKWATAQHGSDDGDASATPSKGRWGILKKQRTR
jgi:hypothetical protein